MVSAIHFPGLTTELTPTKWGCLGGRIRCDVGKLPHDRINLFDILVFPRRDSAPVRTRHNDTRGIPSTMLIEPRVIVVVMEDIVNELL